MVLVNLHPMPKLTPVRAAVIAAVLALPMAFLYAGIELEMTAVETFFKSFLTDDGDRPNTLGFIYMGIGMLALPVGLVIALWPMFKKGTDGKRHVHIANVLVAIVIVIIMWPTWGGVMKDFVKCDILEIPNCD